MAVKIHLYLQYRDAATYKRHGGMLDMDAAKEFITQQNSGSVPFAVGFKEIAAEIDIVESTARKIFLTHNRNFCNSSATNSCYTAGWFDQTLARLIRPDVFEQEVPIGAIPVIFEAADVDDGNQRYRDGKRERAAAYGRLGGRGNKRVAGTIILGRIDLMTIKFPALARRQSFASVGGNSASSRQAEI